MPELYNMLFVMQFIIVIGIILFELYNLMRVSRAYSLMTDFMLFIGFFLAFVVGLLITMLNTTEYLFHLLFRLEVLFLLLNVLFFISSLMLKMSYLVKDGKKNRQAYNSFRERRAERG